MSEPSSVRVTFYFASFLIYDLVTDPQFRLFPCGDPFQKALEQELLPSRFSPPPNPNTPILYVFLLRQNKDIGDLKNK